jgi:hypothetical protein
MLKSIIFSSNFLATQRLASFDAKLRALKQSEESKSINYYNLLKLLFFYLAKQRLASFRAKLSIAKQSVESRPKNYSLLKLFKLTFCSLLFFSISCRAEEKILSTNLDKETIVNQDGEIVEENFVHDKKNATIQILNKITAKAQYLNMPIKSQVTLGTLTINIDNCWKSSPYDLSDNKILLKVSEKKIGQDKYNIIFNGWMFSSSPGISSLEHAVYDIVAINCYD